MQLFARTRSDHEVVSGLGRVPFDIEGKPVLPFVVGKGTEEDGKVVPTRTCGAEHEAGRRISGYLTRSRPGCDSERSQSIRAGPDDGCAGIEQPLVGLRAAAGPCLVERWVVRFLYGGP